MTEKKSLSKITDKNQRGGNWTKTVVIIGFPVVIFCSASLEMDEQESTRFFLLSPEINEEKIRESIIAKIRRGSDTSVYDSLLESREDRKLLKERILAIKNEHIDEIKISNPTLIEEMFLKRVSKSFKPRHSRDIGRIINLVKIYALLNFMYREKKDGALIAEEEDIKEAFKIWDSISQSQELNLPPYVLNIFIDVIIPAFKEAKSKSEQESDMEGTLFSGISYQQILKKHFDVFGRYLPLWQLRQQIITPLETAGLITQDRDLVDKRKVLITPTTELTTSSEEKYSEEHSGVEDK